MKLKIHTLFQRVTSPAMLLAMGIGALCLLLHWLGLEQSLRFDRDAIASGSIWLLLSGNFVHLGTSHLLMNLAGLALVAALVWSRFSAWEWVLITLFSSLVVGLALYWFDPEVSWYVGFSGTLHGLIIAGAMADLRYYPKSAAVLLVLVVAKLAWEQVAGALPGSESVAGGHVLVNAHLYGAIGGAVMGAWLLLRRVTKKMAKQMTPDPD